VTLARVPVSSSTATPVAPPRGRATLGLDTVPGVGIALAIAAVIAAFGIAYAIGHSARPSSDEAANARREAESKAFASAQRDEAVRGRGAGARAGESAGTAAGTRAGRRAAGASRAARAAPAPGQIKDCPSTPIRSASVVSSVRGISCLAAAAEQRKALVAGHPTRTAKGFTCQRLDPKHYRCTKGAQAYRWDITK
jgi:hypothetical protein